MSESIQIYCSYGALTCYFGESHFIYYKKNFEKLTLFLAIFVFTKIYEGVVTVNGEDLGDRTEEKKYYDLAYESLEMQFKVVDVLIDYYTNKPKDAINEILERYLGNGSQERKDLRK